MCRFTLYLGPSITLSSLLLEPDHSLIRQSSHSREREEPLNGDGFGVGWYATHFSSEPAVFRSITPAWNNRNLHNLARVVDSDCILAHVRAATQFSGVNEANCHPFRFRQYLFMHNGDIGGFRAVRRRLLDSVCDEAFGNVYGSTDSEHFFAVLIDQLLRSSQNGDPAETLAAAMSMTIHRVTEIVARHGGGEASYLNCAVADGDCAVVSRFTDDHAEDPESLYYFTGQLYPCAEEDGRKGEMPVIVSSERLTGDPGWEAIPPNHVVLLRRDQAPEVRPYQK
ncbi:MAG: class II glutamine amidotransferase [Gammaproteobacteria bacterium]|nr:class II glutamine amidotransferase [Gammaproteobacteria bacterium]